MNIRLATADDLEAITHIENETQRYPWSASLFSSCFGEGYRFLVLEESESYSENKIAAFLLLQETQFDATIMNIAVHPAAQRKGYATALLLPEIQRMSGVGCEQLLLEVRASNKGAIGFYQDLGFVKVGCRTGYYPVMQGREDAWVYSLPLSSA